jgi:hypothetical protein
VVGLGGGDRRASPRPRDQGHEWHERGEQHGAVGARERPVGAERDRERGGRARRGEQAGRRTHRERRDERGDPEPGGQQEDGRPDRGTERGARQVGERGGRAGSGGLDVEAEHERADENARQPGGQRPRAQALDEPFDGLDEQPQPAAERADAHHQAHRCVRSNTADE